MVPTTINVNKNGLSQRAATVLAAGGSGLMSKRVTIGLDGFVDEIVSVVDKRESAEKFTRVPTLSALADRISQAVGKGTNAELVVTRVKLGGNGPIMANALAALGARVTYIGSLGYPTLHPAFEELARGATVYSIAEPGHTDALEFDDGKLMLGKHATLGDITWQHLIERVGREKLFETFATSHLVGLQNWTMLPHMSDIWQQVLEEFCPRLPAHPQRTIFFDLADPEKRDPRDIRRALELVGRFQKFFETYLGLNEKESFEVGRVLGYDGSTEGENAVTAVADFIQRIVKISAVVVHPRAYAVATDGREIVQVQGPFTESPLISTGAGDHFNTGFCLGKLMGADNEIALQLGVATSGYYVRTAQSPTRGELAEFLQSL